jgi:hypothetical protein
MTDLDALTAACLDDPDDEGRLAVLGDRLEERGDARAEAAPLSAQRVCIALKRPPVFHRPNH